MNTYHRLNLFYFFIIFCAVFYHAKIDATILSKPDTHDQEGSLIVIPCSEERLLKSSYKIPLLPKTAQTKLLFSVNITPAKNNQLQATLVTTRLNKKNSLYEPNSTSAQTFIDNSLTKVLCKVLSGLKNRSIQIKTLLFASESDLVSSSMPTQKHSYSPWLNKPNISTDRMEYFAELPLSIPSFAAMIMELKNIYDQQFHTIALTQAPCSLECAYELAPATTYFVTTNPTNTPPLGNTTKAFSLEKDRPTIIQTIDTTITEDLDIIPSLFEVIYNWFNSRETSTFGEERNNEILTPDTKKLTALTRNYMGASYNVIDCQKTITITQNFTLLLNNFFGQIGTINQKKQLPQTLTAVSGLDQMTLKLIGVLFFEEILKQDNAINNHHIDAGLLCSLLAKATSDRLDAIRPQREASIFRNIYIKNKHIAPRLAEIKQLAEETHLLIMQATPNGSASLYMPYPDEIANDAFQESQFLYATRLDRLYLLLQIHLLMLEDAVATI